MRWKNGRAKDSSRHRSLSIAGALLSILLLGISLHVRPDRAEPAPSSSFEPASGQAVAVPLAQRTPEEKRSRVLSAVPPRPEQKPLGEDLGAVYLNAYMMADEARQLEVDGDLDAAIEKLDKAKGILDQIAREAGEWRQEVVQYRRRKVSETLDRLAMGVRLPAKQRPAPTPPVQPEAQSIEPGAGDDMGSTYLGAYMLAQEGAEFENAGNRISALAKYQEAAAILKAIERSSPNWRREVVAYRTRKISDSIARVASN